MAKYLVAVSGGVDSVVLLDKLVRAGEHELIVAHFDHGIRQDSENDERFVAGLARSYNLPYESSREALGSTASEQLARTRRYAFLRQKAKEHGAIITTAHHRDDVVETIAINFERGTGWRGLAVLGVQDIWRPLTDKTKQELYDYALAYQLEFVEDETNKSDKYLRNRLRLRIAHDETVQKKLAELRVKQQLLRTEIDAEVAQYRHNRMRDFYRRIPEECGLEILRSATETKLTPPQLMRLLYAIKNARSNTKSEPGAKMSVSIGSETFVLTS